MIDYAYYNGVFTPYDSCCIPISDRAITFGEAVYDVVIGRRGTPYQLNEHLERLLGNAQKIGLSDIPEKEVLEDAVSMLLSEAEADEFTLYLQLSGNAVRRQHTRSENSVNTLITVVASDIPTKPGFTEAITLPDLRHGYCNVKTTNLLPAVLSIERAMRVGADLAIFEKDGYVTECSHANVSIVQGDTLVTHPLDTSILPGIAERNLVRVAGEMGIKHEIRKFTLREMLYAELVLITSTTKLIKVCKRINGTELYRSNAELAERIFDAMRADLIAKT